MSWKRLLLFAVALNALLFFRGCEQSGDLQLTAGVFVPYQTVEIDESGAFEGIESTSFSLPLLALNLALAAALLTLIKRWLPRLDTFLGSRGFLIVASVTFVVFNLIFIPNPIYAHAVFWPTGYLYEAIVSLFYSGDLRSVPHVYIDTAARLYLLLFLAVLSLIPIAVAWIRRKLAAAPGPSCLTVREDLKDSDHPHGKGATPPL